MFAKELAFVVLFLVVGQQALIRPVEDEAEFRALSDHAEASLEKLRQRLEVMSKDAEKKLNGLVDEVKRKGDEIIEKNKAKMAKESAKLIEEIEDIENEARELGLALSFDEQKKQIKDIQEKSTAALIVCVAKKVEEFVQIVKNIINKILSTIEFYAGVKEQIENCKAGSNKVVCIIRVIGEIIDKTLTLPVYILNEVAKAATLVSTFVNDILACAAQNRLHFEQESSYVLAQTRAAVLKRLN